MANIHSLSAILKYYTDPDNTLEDIFEDAKIIGPLENRIESLEAAYFEGQDYRKNGLQNATKYICQLPRNLSEDDLYGQVGEIYQRIWGLDGEEFDIQETREIIQYELDKEKYVKAIQAIWYYDESYPGSISNA